MDPLGMNKWAAAVISAVLLIMVIRTGSDMIFHTEDDGQLAYSVEVAETADGAAAEVVEGPTMAELLAVADVTRGAREYAKCKTCHTVEKGGKQGTGPNLYDLLGREIAGVDGFRYSSALTEIGGSWNYENLDAWLKSPKTFAKGTSMSFAGVRKDDARANLIAYLRDFSDSPMALPVVEEKVEEVMDAVEDAVSQ